MKRATLLFIVSIVTIPLLLGGCTEKPVRESTECSEWIAAPSDSTSAFTYTLDSSLKTTTLEVAEDIMGIPVPTPLCLPEGYSIQEVYIRELEYIIGNEVLLIISDEAIEHQDFDITTKMVIHISYGCGPGLKMPWAEVATIREDPRLIGMFVSDKSYTGGDHNELWYQFGPSIYGPSIGDPTECFEIVIMAIKDIPKGDLAKIARSTLF